MYSSKYIHWKTPVMTPLFVQLQVSGLTASGKSDSSQMLSFELCKVLQNIIFK